MWLLLVPLGNFDRYHALSRTFEQHDQPITHGVPGVSASGHPRVSPHQRCPINPTVASVIRVATGANAMLG